MSETNAERALRAVREYAAKNGIGRSLAGHDPHGEPEGLVCDHMALEGLHASTHILVKDIADQLTRKMPGFAWAIQPSEFGKVFNIFCLDFSGRWGYRIKYTDIMNDPKRKEAVKAGRELLRRFGYPGTLYKVALMAEVPRNAVGEAIPIVDDLKQDRFTMRATIERAIVEGRARVVGTKGSGQIIEVREGAKYRE